MNHRGETGVGLVVARRHCPELPDPCEDIPGPVPPLVHLPVMLPGHCPPSRRRWRASAAGVTSRPGPCRHRGSSPEPAGADAMSVSGIALGDDSIRRGALHRHMVARGHLKGRSWHASRRVGSERNVMGSRNRRPRQPRGGSAQEEGEDGPDRRPQDGDDRDAMSPVRIPTVAEEDAKRLLRERERLVKERLRLANPVDGLLGLHGVSAGDPAKKGFRARLDGPETGCGTELPPRRRLRGRRPGRGTGSGEWTLRGGAGQAARDRRERRPAPGRRAALPGLPEPPGAGRPCGAGAGSPGERRRRPGDRQGRQPDAAKAPGADGLALSKWFREHVGAGDGRAEAGDRGTGAQAAGGAVEIRHRRARAEEDNETSGHPGGPTGPPGNPGKACDRREAWFAAGQPDRIRAWTRRRARRGAATFCLEHPRAALTLPLPTERNDVKAETEPAVERRLTATGKGMPGPAPPRCRKRGDGGVRKSA